MTEEKLENKNEKKTKRTQEGGKRIRKTYNKKPREKKDVDNKSVSVIKKENKTTRRRTKKEYNVENKEKKNVEKKEKNKKDIFNFYTHIICAWLLYWSIFIIWPL